MLKTFIVFYVIQYSIACNIIQCIILDSITLLNARRRAERRNKFYCSENTIDIVHDLTVLLMCLFLFIVIMVYICFRIILFSLNFFFIYWFQREGKGGRKRGRETLMWKRNIDQLPPACGPTGDQTYKSCALTGNWTQDLLVHRTTPNQLSHSSQGDPFFIF